MVLYSLNKKILLINFVLELKEAIELFIYYTNIHIKIKFFFKIEMNLSKYCKRWIMKFITDFNLIFNQKFFY